jgi:hypothetical protein
MTVVTYTRRARCKDCAFLKAAKVKGLKRNKCVNPESQHNEQPRTQKDFVCDKWELIY